MNECEENCKQCDYVIDTPLGSYCSLTNEPIQTTDCHYDEEKGMEELYKTLIKGMRQINGKE